MIFFLLLILLSSSAYSMSYLDHLGRQQHDNNEVLQECHRDLQTYDDFIPGSPCVGLMIGCPGFLEFMQEVANQDALWANRPERVVRLLESMIENRMYDFSDNQQLANVLEIFLTAAAQRKHTQFIDSILPTILKVSIEKNNIACTEVALKRGTSLKIQCYSQHDRKFYGPLKFAYTTFGIDSPLVELLCKYNAPMEPEDRIL